MRAWKRMVSAVMLTVAFAGLFVSCGGDTEGETVLVMAAASLTDAFTEIASEFEVAHPGIDIHLNLAGSSALREQILEGAPAHVFASADERTMDAVVAAGEIVGEPVVFAGNELVIAMPVRNQAEVQGLADLADGGLLIGLCAVGVPCGDFARHALRQAGISAAIDTNEPDVRALLTKIEAGELDAGIVYRTDVVGRSDVDSVELPPEVNLAVHYPIARLSGTPSGGGADEFIAYVRSAKGQQILVRHGFLPPGAGS